MGQDKAQPKPARSLDPDICADVDDIIKSIQALQSNPPDDEQTTDDEVGKDGVDLRSIIMDLEGLARAMKDDFDRPPAEKTASRSFSAVSASLKQCSKEEHYMPLDGPIKARSSRSISCNIAVDSCRGLPCCLEWQVAAGMAFLRFVGADTAHGFGLKQAVLRGFLTWIGAGSLDDKPESELADAIGLLASAVAVCRCRILQSHRQHHLPSLAVLVIILRSQA